MTDYLATIDLPAAVRFVKVGEAATMTSSALYPSSDAKSIVNDVKREVSRESHESALRDAISQGKVTPLNPISYAPEPWRTHDLLRRAVIARAEFVEFANGLSITVTDLGERAQNVASDGGDSDTTALSPACAVFREMKNLNFSEVAVQFAAGDSGSVVLNISARGKSKRVTLQEFDLYDRRKAEINLQGGLLLAFAQGSGRKVRIDGSNSRRMSRLRELINRHLGLTGDPFEPYSDSRGWVPLFQILDKRDAATERAEREANRKTDSLDLPEVLARVEQAQADDYQPAEDDGSEDDPADNWLKENDRAR